MKTTFSFPLSGNMASKPLTPQTAAMASLREFENALESLKSAFCLYAECKDLSDPYDDHQQGVGMSCEEHSNVSFNTQAQM